MNELVIKFMIVLSFSIKVLVINKVKTIPLRRQKKTAGREEGRLNLWAEFIFCKSQTPDCLRSCKHNMTVTHFSAIFSLCHCQSTSRFIVSYWQLRAASQNMQYGVTGPIFSHVSTDAVW